MLKRNELHLNWEGKISFFSYFELKEYIAWYYVQKYKIFLSEQMEKQRAIIESNNLPETQEKEEIQEYEKYYKNLEEHDIDVIWAAVETEFYIYYEGKSDFYKFFHRKVYFDLKCLSKWVSFQMLVSTEDVSEIFDHYAIVDCKKLTITFKENTTKTEL